MSRTKEEISKWTLEDCIDFVKQITDSYKGTPTEDNLESVYRSFRTNHVAGYSLLRLTDDEWKELIPETGLRRHIQEELKKTVRTKESTFKSACNWMPVIALDQVAQMLQKFCSSHFRIIQKKKFKFSVLLFLGFLSIMMIIRFTRKVSMAPVTAQAFSFQPMYNNKEHSGQNNTVRNFWNGLFQKERYNFNADSLFSDGKKDVIDKQRATSDHYWQQFFETVKRETVVPEQQLAEQAIAVFLPETSTPHAMMRRFPLGPIPVVIETKSGICLLGTVCAKALENNASTSIWTPDPHVRDILATILLKCSIRGNPDDCFAIDVGSNMGTHTLAMLQLGARVVAIEPQTDLCVASRIAAAYSGFANRCYIICGGVSSTRIRDPSARLSVGSKNHRYGADASKLPYKLDPVPLYSLEQLVSTQKKVHFLKIDTDSIDCLVLQQALDLMKEGRIEIDAIILESWDGTCSHQNLIGNQILYLVRNGYTMHRTLVFERSWDDNRWDYENNFKRVELPNGWTEQFHVGFNFVLWKADGDKMSDQELLSHPNRHPQWQYLFTKGIQVVQAGYRTREQ